MEALVVGATGATGKDLLNLLLEDGAFKKVSIFVRRNVPLINDKLYTNIIDFNNPDQWQKLVKGDVLFSCLGTTLKAAGSTEAQWKIDYDYQYEFAKAAKENGIQNYVLVSSGFASAKSPFFYARMKGQLEEDIKKLGFKKTIILNPPLLERKHSKRSAEVRQVKIFNFLSSLGILKSQKPLQTAVLAEAMINALMKLSNGTHAIKQQNILNYKMT